MDQFQRYANISDRISSMVVASGRYSAQKGAIKNILSDVIEKLEIEENDHVLDIGCNQGLLTIPISFVCDKVTAVDNDRCIDKLREHTKYIDNIEYISENFLEAVINEKFDKILIYSVIHYLPDDAGVKKFVLKAAELLKPGGRLLLGDIPNQDKKRRFLASDYGRKFDSEFKAHLKYSNEDVEALEIQSQENSAEFNDDNILNLLGYLRQAGFDSYIIPQKEILPFGNTREDIIVYNMR